MNARTVWGRRLDEVLADGEWHPLEEVLVAVAAAVPPGRAFRVGEAGRVRQGNTGPRARGDQSTAIAAGARAVARDTVDKRVVRGTVERAGGRVRKAS